MTSHLDGSLIAVARTPHLAKTHPLCWHVQEIMQPAVIIHLGVSKNNGTPKSSIFNRVFHYKPSILGYPYFWNHPLFVFQFTWDSSFHDVPGAACCSDLGLNEDIFPCNATLPKGFASMLIDAMIQNDLNNAGIYKYIIVWTYDQHRPCTLHIHAYT